MIVCTKCGCDKVQTVTWVEINTNEVQGEACSEGQDEGDNWCPDCDAHCGLIEKSDYDKINRCYLCKENEYEVTELIVEGDRYVCDNCIINR